MLGDSEGHSSEVIYTILVLAALPGSLECRLAYRHKLGNPKSQNEAMLRQMEGLRF
jgi:hypothetical protein